MLRISCSMSASVGCRAAGAASGLPSSILPKPQRISSRKVDTPLGSGLPLRGRFDFAALCRLASAPRRNFSSRFLCRNSFSAAFASAADATLTATVVPSIFVKRRAASCKEETLMR